MLSVNGHPNLKLCYQLLEGASRRNFASNISGARANARYRSKAIENTACEIAVILEDTMRHGMNRKKIGAIIYINGVVKETIGITSESMLLKEMGGSHASNSKNA